MSFWYELQRRKVVRVAVVYAVTAWLLIQIVTSIEEPLSLPGWIDTFIIVILAIGFPIALILSWAFDVTPGGIRPTPDSQSGQTPHRSASQSAHWVSHAGQLLILLAVGFLVADQFVFDDSSPAPASNGSANGRAIQRVSITLPAEHTAAFGWFPGISVAISPDGRTIAYTSSAWNDQSQIHHLAVRELGSLEVREVPGSTNGGFQPFFSPDSRWVAFFTQDGFLKKAPLAGGNAIVVTDDILGGVWAMGVWTDNDEIVYRDTDTRVYRVSANGGQPEELAGPTLSGQRPGQPDFVRASDSVIIPYDGDLVAFDLGTGTRKTILEDVNAARFIETGHLVFQRDDAILITAIDPVTLELQGELLPLTDSVRQDGITGEGDIAQFDVADNGDLLYARAGEARSRLYRVDRNGNATLLPFPADMYGLVAVSPDGRTVAVEIDYGSEGHVLLLDPGRGTISRLQSLNIIDRTPRWRPDGKAIVTWSENAERQGVVEHVLGGETRWLWTHEGTGSCCRNFSWAPEQRALLMIGDDVSQEDIRILELADDAVVEPLIATPANEQSPSVSPDGKWLAYISDETGQPQLYIRRYPDGVDLPISRDFAQGPVWARNSSELFFQGNHDGVLTMLAVKVSDAGGATADLDDIEPLFPLRTVSGATRIDAYRVSVNLGPSFGVLPNGDFVIARSEDQTRYRELVLIQNLELPAREPAGE